MTKTNLWRQPKIRRGSSTTSLGSQTQESSSYNTPTHWNATKYCKGHQKWGFKRTGNQNRKKISWRSKASCHCLNMHAVNNLKPHTLYEQDEKQEQEEDMNVKGIKLIVNSVNSILRMKAFVLWLWWGPCNLGKARPGIKRTAEKNKQKRGPNGAGRERWKRAVGRGSSV